MGLRRYGGYGAAQSELSIELRVAALGGVDDHAPGLHPAVQLLNFIGAETVGGRENEEQARRR